MKRQLSFCFFFLLMGFTFLHPAAAALPPSTRDGTPFCGVSNWQPDSRRYARTLANLNVGEPRTVRLIYFLPNDRPFRAEVAQRMKDEIRNLQTFFAKQMGAHGYGRRTFSLETDARGEPMVHRVNGQHPDSYYITAINVGSVFTEVESAFDANSNVYLIVLDNSTADLGEGIAGLGTRYSKNGGDALVTDEFEWWVAAHELGHAFGLKHDFRDGAYIMSYGPGEERLSKCSAEFLVSHPYLNPAVPIEEGSSPTIEPVSPLRYPAGSKSISLQFKIGDSDGIHQALLFVETVQPHLSAGDIEVKACHGLRHDRNFIFNFEYDGVIPSDGLTNLSNPTAHPITVGAVDAGGNFHTENFILAETSRDYIASLEGHTDWVDFVSFSHDGKTLASGALDGAVRLWDVEMETSIIVPVPVALSVSLSPNGRTLALGSWDGRVTLWNVATRQNIATLEAHINAVSSVSFAPDGKTLASGSSEGTVRLWSVATRQNIATFRGHTNWVSSVSFSPDGKTLASGAEDGAVKLWNVATRQNIATLEAHIDGVSSVSFAPDGKTLASGSSDRTVKLWDVETELNFTTLAHVSPVTAISFSRDGSLLASGTAAGTVELWDTSRWMQSRLDAATEVKIPDPNLRAAISTALGLPPSAPILAAHMETLKELEALEASISDLTGLEWALNLRWLFLESNSISNVFPLAGLTNLKVLRLAFNSISDLSPVSGLLNLADLNLPGNHIADISAISGLTNLRVLDLAFNSISDLAPLAANIGLGDGDLVDVRGNPLNYLSIQAHISSLQERGVSVDFDIWTPASLVKIAGDQHGPPATPLPNPFVVEVRDGDGLRLEGVSVAFGITAGGGTLSTTSTTTDADGRARSVLTLGPNSGITIVSVAAGGIETPVTFTAVARDGVVIPDSNLRAAVGNMLGKAPGAPLVPAEIATLTEFYAPEASIGDLTGLEFAINLIRLNLNDNSISDVSPVSGLTNLTALYLDSNDISNISAISGLTNLTLLVLASNNISDISAVSGLTNLTALYLDNNDISNISAISGLTNLTQLALASDNISDISAVSGLTNLTALYLDNNDISNISAISGLTNLTQLALASNNISDISAVSGLTHLTTLSLYNNDISNISAISGLTNLTSLVLAENDISDISAVSGLTNLTWLALARNSISDLSPLVSNMGLGEGDFVSVEVNPLSYASIHVSIPTLQGRGVEAVFFDRTPTALLKISGDRQTGKSGAELANPFVVEVRDSNDSAFEGVPVTYTVTQGGGTLSVRSTKTDANGRAESTFTLGPNAGTNTVEVSATGVEGTVIFSSVPQEVPIATSDATLSIVPSPAPSPAIGEQLTLSLNIAHGENVAGYQATVQFNNSALRFISSAIGDYLPAGAFPLNAAASGNTVTLAATSLAGESNGDGTLATLTFEVIAVEASTLMLSDVILSDSAGTPSRPNVEDGRVVERPQLKGDINRDGIVNILDLVLVAGQFGQSGQNNADVNGDGIVNILDLVLVAGAFGNVAAAPASDPGDLATLTAADVGHWLAQARQLDLTDATVQRGVLVLERLSAAFTPNETSLLPNYPNPFNPETWIPYQLAKAADVRLTLYAVDGTVVRNLALGYQLVGTYQSKSRAAYWDGRNLFGETVASGIYFYTLNAGDFSATRRMLIRK